MKKKTKDAIAIALFVAACLYVVVAELVWSWRHPWASEMERFLHLWDALCWRDVPYEEMRPR